MLNSANSVDCLDDKIVILLELLSLIWNFRWRAAFGAPRTVETRQKEVHLLSGDWFAYESALDNRTRPILSDSGIWFRTAAFCSPILRTSPERPDEKTACKTIAQRVKNDLWALQFTSALAIRRVFSSVESNGLVTIELLLITDGKSHSNLKQHAQRTRRLGRWKIIRTNWLIGDRWLATTQSGRAVLDKREFALSVGNSARNRSEHRQPCDSV